MVPSETIFTMDTSSIKYGPGATRELGYEMRRLGATRVMVVTDPNLARGEPVAVALASLRAAGLDAVLFDRARVEPTDASFKEAIAFATEGRFDGYVAVGGGSSIDTAKAANLYATHPADFLTYVNPPIGQGRPVPGPLKPLIAVPTTAPTRSATSGRARRSGWSPATSSGRVGTRPPRRRAARCSWPPPTRASASATPASTCRTACPTRWRGWCATTGPTGTPSTTRSSRTACR